jgi:hypothetical protein
MRVWTSKSIFARLETHIDQHLSETIYTRKEKLPFLMGIRLSNQKLFSGTKETRAEEEKIEHTTRKIQDAKGQKISVLFLFVGIDTLTTDNKTCAGLISRFKDVDFFLTSVCPAELANYYPSVFKSSNGFAWAHCFEHSNNFKVKVLVPQHTQ